MSLPLGTVEQIVLQNAREWSRLYEIIWELNGLFPEASLGDKYSAAEEVVRALIYKDAILLYKHTGGFFAISPEYQQIPEAEVDKILSSPTSWYPEYADECILIGIPK